MKHARKMVLVDASTHGGGSGVASQNFNKNIDPLTQAIKSLANSAEFNKTHFGSSTTAVSRLNNEMEQILERRDLDPSSKLKLYNQELKRFLFLHRESDRKSAPPPPSRTPATASGTRLGSETAFEAVPGYESTSDEMDIQSLPDSEMGAVGGYPREPVSYTIPLRQPLNSPVEGFSTPKKRPSTSSSKWPPPKRYKSNLPRTTPKHEILRQNRKLKRMGSFDYFEDWNSKRKRI